MNSVNWRKQYHRMNTNRYSTITRLFTRKKPSWRCSGESGAKTRGFAPSSKRDSFISKRRISNRLPLQLWSKIRWKTCWGTSRITVLGLGRKRWSLVNQPLLTFNRFNGLCRPELPLVRWMWLTLSVDNMRYSTQPRTTWIPAGKFTNLKWQGRSFLVSHPGPPYSAKNEKVLFPQTETTLDHTVATESRSLPITRTFMSWVATLKRNLVQIQGAPYLWEITVKTLHHLKVSHRRLWPALLNRS